MAIPRTDSFLMFIRIDRMMPWLSSGRTNRRSLCPLLTSHTNHRNPHGLSGMDGLDLRWITHSPLSRAGVAPLGP